MEAEFGVTKVDTWALVGEMATQMAASLDPTESLHGDLWMDQAMNRFNLVHTI